MVYTDILDIKYIKEFLNSCKLGNLEDVKMRFHNVVEILYRESIKKPHIDIFELAFKSACENGSLEVAQWLQSLKPFKYSIKIKNKIKK